MRDQSGAFQARLLEKWQARAHRSMVLLQGISLDGGNSSRIEAKGDLSVIRKRPLKRWRARTLPGVLGGGAAPVEATTRSIQPP